MTVATFAKVYHELISQPWYKTEYLSIVSNNTLPTETTKDEQLSITMMYPKDGAAFPIRKNHTAAPGPIINPTIKSASDNDKSMRFEGEFFRIFKGSL
ncbi:hypothetical protein pdam_00002766 [Pocillopora damicornis]|uniref:Uncharacterized protein n=1 Tax=Pocillopora damicornis TaxID=46731 RepID=A0A3M6TTP6_POCDA|nr:hypothetical protein pdam_00002766 [Pocillopora damicornis]